MSGTSSELNPMPQEEPKFPEGSRIIPINPASKYVVLVPQDTPVGKLDELANFLTAWWHDENPFLLMTDEIVLVDVTRADVVEEEDNAEKEEN